MPLCASTLRVPVPGSLCFLCRTPGWRDVSADCAARASGIQSDPQSGLYSDRFRNPARPQALGAGGTLVVRMVKLRKPGVEPGSQAWEACMMPLHYMRLRCDFRASTYESYVMCFGTTNSHCSHQHQCCSVMSCCCDICCIPVASIIEFIHITLPCMT